jgi:hypothetical protein
VSRRVVITAALAFLAAVAPAAPARGEPVALMPGVTYERQTTLARHGPVVLHVVSAPRPGGLYSLEPALSNDAVPGKEKLTSIMQRLAGRGSVVGINGDLSAPDGRPAGLLVRGGRLEHAPRADRVSLGIDADGSLRAERVRLFATWQGRGPRRSFAAFNEPPGPNGVALFTPAWGPLAPPQDGASVLVLQPFSTLRPGGDASGVVVQVEGGSGAAIPADGAVLVARGTAAEKLVAEAEVGTTVTVRTVLKPDWRAVVQGLGGGPLLVRGGAPVFRSFEAFAPELVARRAPRSAVAQRADGSILLVAVDGRRFGYSVGMTTFELAQALVRLGAVTAVGLDAGDATTLAFDGTLLNRPSGTDGEAPVSEGLLVVYEGVTAPPPAQAVVSPNGDAVGDEQVVSYRLARRSTVTHSLVAPDGSARAAETAPREPGTYTVTWNGRTPEGGVEPEGAWRFVVSAVDDLGRQSAAERPFALNTTLAFLRPADRAVRAPAAEQPVATYELARAADVDVTIETERGTVVRRLQRARLEPGAQTVVWDGADDAGRPAWSGRYVVRVTARNEVGAVALTAPLSVQRARG